jgi:hypothetical protein
MPVIFGHLRESDIARLQASPYHSCFDFCFSFFPLLLLLGGQEILQCIVENDSGNRVYCFINRCKSSWRFLYFILLSIALLYTATVFG